MHAGQGWEAGFGDEAVELVGDAVGVDGAAAFVGEDQVVVDPPDGPRSLSTPAELARAAAARCEHAGKTSAQLLALVDDYDYLADRVYGKVADNDQDVKRIEQTTAQAAALRQFAIELQTTASEPAAADPATSHLGD